MIDTRDLKRDNAAYQMGKADKVNGKPKKTLAQFKLAIGGTIDADDYPLYEAGYAADRDDLDFDPDAKNGPLVPGKETKPTKAQRMANEMIVRAGVCSGPGPCDTSVIGTGKNWVTKVNGLPAYIRAIAHALIRNGHSEQDAISLAVGTVHRWAAGGGNVTAGTKARAAAALAEWEAKRAKAHAGRSERRLQRRQMTEFGASGPPQPSASDATALLPVAPVPKRPKPRQGNLPLVPHAFSGTNLMDCRKCGKPATDRIHRSSSRRSLPTADHPLTRFERSSLDQVTERLSEYVITEVRHRGKEGHLHLPSGHVASIATQKRRAKAQQDALIPTWETTMRGLFERQEKATLSRLTGKRGKRALRDLQVRAQSQSGQQQPAQQPPPNPPPPSIAPAAIQGATGALSALASEGALVVQAAKAAGSAGFVAGASGGMMLGAALYGLPQAVRQIFDPDFWTQETAKTVEPLYQDVADSAKSEVLRQVGKPNLAKTPAPDAEGKPRPSRDSLAKEAQQAAIMARPNQLAGGVTDTTYKAIQQAMADGIAANEAPTQIAHRIRQVFTDASQQRAKTIARTEVHAALNATSNAYAENLPPGIVGGKKWLSLHDDRVRPAHAAADGQVRPLGSPFLIGGFPGMFPGDPSLPPSESINCRCSLAFVSPSEASKAGVYSGLSIVPTQEAS